MIRAFPAIGRFIRTNLMEPIRRFQLALIILVLLVATGAMGYHFIEHMGVIDSLYMTLITITTVGFGEVHPLSPQGRIFTMALITLGVGTAAWALGTGIEVVLGENLWQSVQRRRLNRDLMNLNNHYIVCGYGRMGRQIVNDLQNRGEDFVVIELSGQAEESLLEKGYPYVIGDAEQNAVLLRAGITTARGLVAALDTDAANVLTVLSARELRSDLLIVARATNETTEGKLRRAGADRVVSPDAIGGHRLALALLQPRVHDFLGKIFNIEELDVDIGEISVDAKSPLAGITVAGTNFKDRWGVTILAIQTEGEEFIISPEAGRMIVPGETLIVIGPLRAISRIEAEFAGT